MPNLFYHYLVASVESPIIYHPPIIRYSHPVGLGTCFSDHVSCQRPIAADSTPSSKGTAGRCLSPCLHPEADYTPPSYAESLSYRGNSLVVCSCSFPILCPPIPVLYDFFELRLLDYNRKSLFLIEVF